MNQVDNLSTRRTREIKIGQMTDLVNRYDADAWGISEHGINLQKRPASKTMASYFDTEVDLRSASSSNTAERSESNHLPGGTATVATNTLCGYIKCTEKDYRNLGRWSWMQQEGEVGHRT